MSTAVAEAPTKPQWEVPEVRPGDWVYWYHGGNVGDIHIPALVLSLGYARGRTLNVMAYFRHGGTRHYEGVRHVDDPDSKGNPEKLTAGGWRHIPGGAAEVRNSLSGMVEETKMYAEMCDAYRRELDDIKRRLTVLETE